MHGFSLYARRKKRYTRLMVTPEQRVELMERIRSFRRTKPIFTMDFQNDAQHVGGCIAGGRRYLHINAAGDVDPCVFIHYSNASIHDCTLLEALQSLFSWLITMDSPSMRICFDHALLKTLKFYLKWSEEQVLIQRIRRHRKVQKKLCARTIDYAEKWAPVAEQIMCERACSKDCSQFLKVKRGYNNVLSNCYRCYS